MMGPGGEEMFVGSLWFFGGGEEFVFGVHDVLIGEVVGELSAFGFVVGFEEGGGCLLHSSNYTFK